MLLLYYAIINNVTMNVGVHIALGYVLVFLFSSAKFLEVKLLEYMALTGLNVLRNTHIEFHSGSPIYNPTDSAPRFPFLSILVNTCLLLFLTKLCPTLCDPMDCSTPGSSVLLFLLEVAQIPLQSVGDDDVF